MKSLLILTDFSTDGDNAAVYGYHLAKELKANVILCNAVIIPGQIAEEGDIAWPINGYDGLIGDSNDELKRLKEHLSTLNRGDGFYPEIICINQTGRLADVVANVTASYKPEIIVMGMHKKGIGHLLIDNNSRNMINATGCPLLLVPAGKFFCDFSKIAFATSLEYPKQDIEDIFKALPLATIFSSEVLVAHVRNVNPLSIDQKNAEAEFLSEISNQTIYPNISYKCVENEYAVGGLESLCKDEEVGLLVMVHRPHDFIDIVLKGSYTQKMASKIDIPLLVLADAKKV